MTKPNIFTLVHPEKTRVYTYPGGDRVELKEVTGVAVSASGNHRVETADGHLHVVAPGWLHIEVEAEDWSF